MMKKSCGLIVPLFLAVSSLIADEQGLHQESFSEEFTPWFTGPLIASSGYTVKPGHYNVEPYLYFYVINGKYGKNWTAEPSRNFYYDLLQIQFKMGIADRVDWQVYPQAGYNSYRGTRSGNIADWPLGVGFQIIKAAVNDPYPALKLTLRSNIPFGKYQKLQPDKQGTDAFGSGSWQPGFSLVFSKLFHTARQHYLDTRLLFNYQFGVHVHVKGLNRYGGAPNTRGVVKLGDRLILDAAFQYNLNQRWALACDVYYTHTNTNHFSGKTGTTRTGTPAKNTAPSSEQFSLAPAIEYNWSKRIGLIAGSWFTFAGRNSNRFASGVVALNIYI